MRSDVQVDVLIADISWSAWLVLMHSSGIASDFPLTFNLVFPGRITSLNLTECFSFSVFSLLVSLSVVAGYTTQYNISYHPLLIWNNTVES